VFGDKVCCAGVQAACEETGEEKVDESIPSPKVDENGVKNKDGEKVDRVPDSGLLRADEAWSKRVE
jgi:hypothetical protein